MTRTKTAVVGLLAVLTVAMTADLSPAVAQRIRSTAERRQHPGRGFWANDSASRRMSHALDYSRGLRSYSQHAAQPTHEMVTTQTREIGRNITGAQERLVEVKKEAEQNKDDATLKSLDSIDQHLAAAAAEQKKCMEECKSETMDMKSIIERCAAMTAGLEKAQAEHDKLMDRLYPPKKE